MTITLVIENITAKQADDLADAIIVYLREIEDIMVSDYEVDT